LVLGPTVWVMKYGWPAWLADHALTAGYTVQARGFVPSLAVTAHVATGSLFIAMAVMLLLRALRLLRQKDSVVGSGALMAGAAT
jgi:hypothetical protein